MNLVFTPPVIAHRGASAYAPENTMAAFIKAVQSGIKWIEFDIMATACQEPIIFHDELLDRTTNARGEVHTYSYAHLQTLDAGSWYHPRFSGEKIPHLQQVLQFMSDMKIAANLEIKSLPGQEEQLVVRILQEIKPYFSMTDTRLLFSSFSREALYYLRKHSSECHIGLLLHEWEPDWQVVCESLQCASLHINHEIMSADAAAIIKKMEKSLLCYTVNDAARANELYTWGVDAVFSDVPDKIIAGF